MKIKNRHSTRQYPWWLRVTDWILLCAAWIVGITVVIVIGMDYIGLPR